MDKYKLCSQERNLVDLKNFLDYNKKVKVEDDTFTKLMFIYDMALKELKNKIEIIKDEYDVLYDYNLIDHINFRIKKPKSILKKMKKKDYKLTYKQMIENINDIAGIRVVCMLRDDVYKIKNMIQSIPGVETVKEKDYLTNPKESGYAAYHIILAVPVTLSQSTIYVKVEVQIRTMAMDYWATMEHEMKYKPKVELDSKKSKEWVKSAKIVKKLEYKMTSLT